MPEEPDKIVATGTTAVKKAVPDQPASPLPDSVPSPGVASDAPTAAPVEHAITLIQFGIELSKREKRVELLNAFIFMQRQAGLHKDTKSAYLARFDAYIHQPVGKG